MHTKKLMMLGFVVMGLLVSLVTFGGGVAMASHTLDDADDDGVLDANDQCPNSDLGATVIIDSCDSGVTNSLFPSGCNLSDRLADCAEGVKNHGKYVSCVARLTNTLKREGVLTGRQKGKIQSCAARADIP